MGKAMNHKRRMRKMETATPQKRRNLLAMHALKRKAAKFPNKKKQASKQACRQPIPE